MLEALRALEWTRPAGLGALVLPLFVWLFARRLARPTAIPVGTFALWASVAGPSRGTRRRRLSLAAWLAIASGIVGALALAGPRAPLEARAPTWTVIVDRSPSMYLSWVASDGTARGTRLEAALAELERLRAERGAALEWVAPAPDEPSRGPAPDVPEAWREPPRAPLAEPFRERYDREGHVWLTDRAPDPPPERAGLVASGGEAVPGAVASRGADALVWDGDAVSWSAGALPPRVLSLDAAIPAPLAELARLWAADRGVEVSEAPEGDPALELSSRGEGPPVAVRAGRAGWWLEGRARRAPLEVDGERLEVWLAARAGGGLLPVVCSAPRRIVVSFETLAEPAGDPASFAVSWADLFDTRLAPAEGVVALNERVGAGPPLARAPGAELGGGDASDPPWDAWLAALAGVLAGVSWLLRR